jgi:nucleoside-diphosphate-sugar epimerase
LNVLVTGATGFVGSHVVQRLALGGHALRLLLRRSSSVAYLEGLEYERVEGEMRDVDSLRRAVQGVDAIVHLAGATSTSSAAEYEAINARGTADLVQIAREAGIERFVYASSLSAQGPSPDGYVQPSEPVFPDGAYGKTKLQGEYAVRAERQRMNVSVLRLPVVYGPRDRGLLPFFVMAKYGFIPLYGNGENQISWIHAFDAADAIVTALEKSEKSGAIFTPCDGAPHTWRELATAVGDAYGKNLRLPELSPSLFKIGGAAADAIAGVIGKQLPLTAEKAARMGKRYWICDNSAIEEQLGWQPQVEYRAGVRHTLDWYRENHWLKLSF